MKITVAYLRDLERKVAKEEISYSRMVELLNERAMKEDESNVPESVISSQVYEPERVLGDVEKYFGPGCAAICKERLRQKEVYGYTPDSDDRKYWENEELAIAAACYALTMEDRLDPFASITIPKNWPWDAKYWKPTPDNRQRELEKAGALVAAQIDVMNF